MDFLLDNTLFWFVIIVALTGLFMLIRGLLAFRQVAEDAEADYDYKSGEGMLESDITREQYIRAYRRYYAPRKYIYAGAGLLFILILTPLLFSLFGVVSMWLWDLAGRPQSYTPTLLVWQFLMFFSMLAMWAGIAYQLAKLYHKNTPRTLRDEMMREVEGL